MTSPHLLVTGATQGIGRACAERFAREGWTVTAIARNEDRLREMASAWEKDFPRSRLIVHPADLSTVEGTDSVPRMEYDVILLNAATFAPGKLLDDVGVYEQLFRLNVLANERLARSLLPRMVERGAGYLVVIGSTGTDHWKDHMTAYVATKYALRGLFLGWEKDLAGSGVRTCLIAPGATLTASWANETPPPGILLPEEVAETVWRAVREGWTGRHLLPSKED
ncbi:SDR family oxidoreductase [Lewinella sp. W8]|uniref:SDR family NAD(P)-dependent oxidoreductase n=1 Tax=Lewinella sp. W8 TaxID=2528208 RepID=UPI00106822E3|nr:SDR family oxidoreductase [Lewinella sp. W8]MTB53728.1 SDR family NAD(P)-dependent oxidoreductase [Lewinella sp. W8]